MCSFFFDFSWERRLFHADQRQRMITHRRVLRGQPDPVFDIANVQEVMRLRLQEQENQVHMIHQLFEAVRPRGAMANAAAGPNIEEVEEFLDAEDMEEGGEEVPHAPPPPAGEGEEEAEGDEDDEEGEAM